MKYHLLGAFAVAVCCTAASASAQGLSRVEVMALQQQLRDDGCGVTHVSGHLDAATRAAVRKCETKYSGATSPASMLAAMKIGFGAGVPMPTLANARAGGGGSMGARGTSGMDRTSGASRTSGRRGTSMMQRDSTMGRNGMMRRDSMMQRNGMMRRDSMMRRNGMMRRDSMMQRNGMMRRDSMMQRNGKMRRDSTMQRNGMMRSRDTSTMPRHTPNMPKHDTMPPMPKRGAKPNTL
ncbi:MAG: hypothetical protein ABI194_02065 [Gemmatimonadaceae bacterium]